MTDSGVGRSTDSADRPGGFCNGKNETEVRVKLERASFWLAPDTFTNGAFQESRSLQFGPLHIR
jgi:hypothetical protein